MAKYIKFNIDGTIREQVDTRTLREAKKEAIERVMVGATDYYVATFKAVPSEDGDVAGTWSEMETFAGLANLLSANKNTEIRTKFDQMFQQRKTLLAAARACTTIAECDAIKWSNPA
jgi:hypothetical protein